SSSTLVRYANTHRPRARVQAIARRADGHVINVSPLWTLQCLSSGPNQMLRQPTLTAKRTMTRAGDVNRDLDGGAAIREPNQMLRQPTLTAKRTMTRAG